MPRPLHLKTVKLVNNSYLTPIKKKITPNHGDVNTEAMPDPADTFLKDAARPSEYPSHKIYPGDWVNLMFQLGESRVMLASMIQVEEHGHYRKLGECRNHKTMQSNFLIAGSCLGVLYQRSLQGQSSQPSELPGFGSCDVERLLSCAREHTPGALL